MNKGFTLAELLVIAAIVSIFVMIAAPNYFEAQTRSAFGRSLADMRNVGNAINAYVLDHKQVPLTQKLTNSSYFAVDYLMLAPGQQSRGYPGGRLTTPVAYLPSIPVDQFNSDLLAKSSWGQSGTGRKVSMVYVWAAYNAPNYQARNDWVAQKRKGGLSMLGFFKTKDFHFWLESAGPDLVWWDFYGNAGQNDVNPFFYDPTNGTVSLGQLVYVDGRGIIAPER